MRPPVAATRQVTNTKTVMFPGYSFPPSLFTIAPPAILDNACTPSRERGEGGRERNG